MIKEGPVNFRETIGWQKSVSSHLFTATRSINLKKKSSLELENLGDGKKEIYN